jgi:hypothetical protein
LEERRFSTSGFTQLPTFSKFSSLAWANWNGFYTNLPPFVCTWKVIHQTAAPKITVSRNSPLFPHFKHFEFEENHFELEYVERLVPQYPNKAVFKAFIQISGKNTRLSSSLHQRILNVHIELRLIKIVHQSFGSVEGCRVLVDCLLS